MSVLELAIRQRGDGPRTVVWIHGYAMDSAVWEPLWAMLPEYRHVGVDLPAHGGSADVEPTAVTRIADAVLAIARRFEARDLVAMSFGGIVGIQAAAQAEAGAVATLTLASPALGGGPQDPESLDCNLELIRMARERGLGPWLHARWMSVPPSIFAGAARRPEIMQGLRKIVEQHRFRELTTGSMRGILEGAQAPLLPRVTAATLLLLGEDDMAAFKRTGDVIRRGIPGAERRYVAGVGHLCLLEDPAEGARLVRAHLSRHDGARG